MIRAYKFIAAMTQEPDEPNMINVSSSGSEATKLPRVLLVEDEVLIRTNLAEELREGNFHVIEAANAEEAWDYLEAGIGPDLVFSDIKMPGAFDGLELADRVRKYFPDIKIIITSGNLGPRPKPDGALFLAKPYRIEQAVAAAKKYLGLG